MEERKELPSHEGMSRLERDLLLTSEISVYPVSLVVARRVQEEAEWRYSDRPELLTEIRKVVGDFFAVFATPEATINDMREGVVKLLNNDKYDPTTVAPSAALIVDALIATEEASKRRAT